MVATVTAHAPASNWRANSCGAICVLPCGASSTPRSRHHPAIVARGCASAPRRAARTAVPRHPRRQGLEPRRRYAWACAPTTRRAAPEPPVQRLPAPGGEPHGVHSPGHAVHLSWHLVTPDDDGSTPPETGAAGPAASDSEDIPEQFRIRQAKRERLLAEGHDLYPVEVARTHSLAEIRTAYPDLPSRHRDRRARSALPGGWCSHATRASFASPPSRKATAPSCRR